MSQWTKPKDSTSLQLCIIGLGNPGKELANTRHNVGYWFIDALSIKLSITLRKQIFRSYLIAEYYISQESNQSNIYKLIILVKPLTYMNNSADIIPGLLHAYGENTQFLIVADNMDLPPGQARLKRTGGTAGHKGLLSISSILHTNFFPLYIGIGHPRGSQTVSSYVLSCPPIKETDSIKIGIEKWSEEVLKLVSEDISSVIQKINSFKVDVPV